MAVKMKLQLVVSDEAHAANGALKLDGVVELADGENVVLLQDLRVAILQSHDIEKGLMVDPLWLLGILRTLINRKKRICEVGVVVSFIKLIKQIRVHRAIHVLLYRFIMQLLVGSIAI